MATTADSQFALFRGTRAPALLADVFDRTAPELFRVAAHLCRGDRAAAEDALQATFLTAIERADDWDARRPLLPWLLGVLVHHVHRQRRAHARTAPLAAAGEPVAAGADPVGDAARREWQTALAGAMRGLPHPYREVLALHVQHGLDAAAIASALGRRPATVRKQIERGLDHLRRMLPMGFALGAAVTLAAPAAAATRARLVAHCGRALPIHPAVAAPPGTVARWPSWRAALLGGAAAVACAAAAWLPGSPPLAAEAAGERIVAVPAAVAAPEPLATNAVPLRTALPPPQQPAAARADEIRVRVLDGDGAPVAGRMVGCVLDDVERFAATDAEGSVTFAHVPVPSVAQVYAVGTDVGELIEDRGFAAADRARDRTLRLARGVGLRIAVRDAAGRPVAGATVEANLGMQPRRMYQPLGCTDADGQLSLRDVAPRGELRAFAPGWLPAAAGLDAEVGQSTTLALLLDEPAGAATVAIVAPDGTALPGAEVAALPRAVGANVPFFAIADAHGVATFASLPCGPFLVTATARATGLVGWLAADHPGAGPLATTLALEHGGTLRGVVEDAGGQPRALGCVSAEWLAPDADVPEYPLLNRCTRLDDGGRYELGGLAAGRWRLRAGSCTHDLELRAGAELTWDAREPALVPLRMRLVDEAGRPLAGWRVVQRNDHGCPTGDWLTTDADGAPAAADLLWRLRPGTLQGLEVHAPRPCDRDDPHDPFATMVVPPLGAGDDVHVVAVPDRLRCNADVAGRLARRNGAPPGRLRVTLCCERSPACSLDVHCDPLDGTFRFEQLSPGRYRLAVDDGAARCARSFALASNEQLELGTLEF